MVHRAARGLRRGRPVGDRVRAGPRRARRAAVHGAQPGQARPGVLRLPAVVRRGAARRPVLGARAAGVAGARAAVRAAVADGAPPAGVAPRARYIRVRSHPFPVHCPAPLPPPPAPVPPRRRRRGKATAPSPASAVASAFALAPGAAGRGLVRRWARGQARPGKPALPQPAPCPIAAPAPEAAAPTSSAKPVGAHPAPPADEHAAGKPGRDLPPSACVAPQSAG